MAMSVMSTISMKHCLIDIPPPKLKALANFSTSSGEHFWSPIVHLSVCPSLSLYTFLNFIFFSRTIGPILAKFCTKHPMRKGFQLFSNESHTIFQWEIIGIWKYTDDIWKSTSPISTKLCTKHPWVKGYQVWSNEKLYLFPQWVKKK